MTTRTIVGALARLPMSIGSWLRLRTEWKGQDVPQECIDYAPLLEPALLVGNDAPFRVLGEVQAGDQDDFAAICDFAGGHKRLNPTAAGRFGIGFNSVYFLTDTPVLFRVGKSTFSTSGTLGSQQGWRFSLDDFPAAAARGP